MLGKLLSDKRILICTFVALGLGLFGSYFGGQISWLARTEQCRDRPEGLDRVCRAWQTPGALWKGTTAGGWTGTILGAFIAGLATRDPQKKETETEFSQKSRRVSTFRNSPPLEGLTPDEIATLRRILRSLLKAEKNRDSSEHKNYTFDQKTPENSSTTLSFSQFLDWADAVAQYSSEPPHLTQNKGREILIYLGFSQTKIDEVWQDLNQKRSGE